MSERCAGSPPRTVRKLNSKISVENKVYLKDRNPVPGAPYDISIARVWFHVLHILSNLSVVDARARENCALSDLSEEETKGT